ncbi:flagellar motor protein MotB [Marinovum sp. KMM 9879]
MASNKDQTIIIRRVEEDEGHAHHGGGWKVAYADFMTAMMAFFLLLWILAASDEEKLRGLADYFTPSLSERGGRGDGFLDGTVLGTEGVLGGADGEAAPVQVPTFGQENPLALFDSRLRDADADPAVAPEQKPDSTVLSDAIEDAAEAMAALEAGHAREAWEATQEQLEQQISDEIASTAGLETLAEHIRFERRQDGLEIQIVDKTGQSMFSSGSARILDRTRKLLQVVAEALADLPNALTITGHTDSRRYAGDGYSNWELSADRANATRRALVENGVNPSRIMRISGLADTAPLGGLSPDAAENRRIGIMVLYPR